MSKTNVWLSVSDLMTGLMVIFLFIAISYISKVNDNQYVLNEYVETKQNLHSKLVAEFEADTSSWKMAIGRDLSMKFKNPSVLFATGSYMLTDEFQHILDEFIPRYLNILLSDKFNDKIVEIRIEGHTDERAYYKYDSDPYIANAILSQKRALSVLRYIRNMAAYKSYTEEEKELLEFWFTANGVSYGKALDTNGEYVQYSGMPIDREKSRRVEFRIVTRGDEVLENFVKNIK